MSIIFSFKEVGKQLSAIKSSNGPLLVAVIHAIVLLAE